MHHNVKRRCVAPNLLNTVVAIACHGCVNSTPVVSVLLPSRRSGEKRLSLLSQRQTSQWSIVKATGQFRSSVSRTSHSNASFCFDFSLLSIPSCRSNKVAFEEVALLSNRLSNWLVILKRAMREDVRWVVDLTAAYDTVWHQGLALKLLQTIPDRHLVCFIIDIIANRSFILKTSDRQCSRLWRLKNGVSQGSTLAPMFFKIYISDISDTVSIQYGYADDLALLFSHKCWNEVEEVLSLNMQRIAEYLSA